ncbi:MAG: peptidylprolyl isomerase [Pseudomonadota bacterium]
MPLKQHHRLFVIMTLLLAAPALPLPAQTTATNTQAIFADGALTNVEPETVVARVGDVSITLGEVIAHRQTLSAQFQQLPDEVLLESLLSQMIDRTLLKQAAQDAGLDRRTAFRLALQNKHREVLAQAYLNTAVHEQITDDALAQAYAEQFTSQPAVPEVRSSHILVESRSYAEEIKAQLDAGADFAALADKFSSDSTASRGGDRGWMSYEEMIPEYGETVRDMATGEIIGPVETPFGWHLIRVDGKRDRPAPPFPSVRAMLIEQISERVARETLERLRNNVPIQRLTGDLPAAAVRADALIQD